MRMVLFQVGEESPGLGVAAVGTPRPDGQKVWFEVPDVRAAAEELAGQGVAALAPPMPIPTGGAVELQDPWGNVLGLTDDSARQELGRRPAAG